MAHVDALLDDAGIEGAVVLDDIITLEQEFSSKSCRGGGSRMQDAVVANADVAD